ncbi:MAG: hypothetical protein K0U66_02595 [Gammaproteobacteria bacterium]|nr:hypothetical protein [Gammaproteobacteria bacterium]
MLLRINNICALVVCTALTIFATSLSAGAGENVREYEFEAVKISSPSGDNHYVCRVRHKGEFLVEVPSICYNLRVADLGQDYLLLTVICCELPNFDGGTVVYAFDKTAGTVTDSLNVIWHRDTIMDRGTPVVVTLWDNGFHVYQENSTNYMQKAHALENGRFTEIKPTDYINLRTLAQETADSIAAISLTRYGPDCYKPEAAFRTIPACVRLYELANAQLREIFSLAGTPSDAEDPDWGCQACRLLRAGRLSWHSPKENQQRVCSSCDNSQLRDSYLLYTLREYAHTLYEETGLTGLYKQGRYHVMENGVLLWSSTKRPADEQFGIVRAPGNNALFILTRPSDQPILGDTIVWTYDRKMQTITDTRSMIAIEGIRYDTDTLTVIEMHGANGFDHPRPPPWPKLYIFNEGRWTEGDWKNYADTATGLSIFWSRIPHFITRIHLECRGDMENCRHKNDFERAQKLYRKARMHSEIAGDRGNLFKEKAQTITWSLTPTSTQ